MENPRIQNLRGVGSQSLPPLLCNVGLTKELAEIYLYVWGKKELTQFQNDQYNLGFQSWNSMYLDFDIVSLHGW